jgi:hypothetical protein
MMLCAVSKIRAATATLSIEPPVAQNQATHVAACYPTLREGANEGGLASPRADYAKP